MKNPLIAPSRYIEKLIHMVRGQKVILDADLAHIYGITTSRLNQQVRRNRSRFPRDFLLEVSEKERAALMLQNATSMCEHSLRCTICR